MPKQQRCDQPMAASRLSTAGDEFPVWVGCWCTRPKVDGQQYDAHRKFEARRPECAVQRSATTVRWAVLDGHQATFESGQTGRSPTPCLAPPASWIFVPWVAVCLLHSSWSRPTRSDHPMEVDLAVRSTLGAANPLSSWKRSSVACNDRRALIAAAALGCSLQFAHQVAHNGDPRVASVPIAVLARCQARNGL